jgi:hypothetical protein
MESKWALAEWIQKLIPLLLLVAMAAGTCRGACSKPQETPHAASAPVVADAAGQEFYVGAQPYWDNPKGLEGLPECFGLKPARSQDELVPLLNRLGEQLSRMVRKIPDLTSLETVVQTRSWPAEMKPLSNTLPMVPQIREYSYLILPHQLGGAVNLEEYRTEISGKRGKPGAKRSNYPFLTKNFALMWSRFYPSNRSESRFRYLGEQKLHRHNTFVLAYAQKPGQVRSPSAIVVEGRAVVVLEQGIAWIDQADYHIRELRVDLLAPRPDIHVRALTTEIRFGEVSIRKLDAPLWLPQQVTVTMLRDDGYFRTEHRYSKYQLFATTSKVISETGDP